MVESAANNPPMLMISRDNLDSEVAPNRRSLSIMDLKDLMEYNNTLNNNMEKEATIISIISTETTKIKSMEAKANNISNKVIIIKIDIKTNKVAAINNINRREVTIRIISKAHLKILFKEETSTIKARTSKSINTMKLSLREIKPLLILPSYQLLISQLNLMTLPSLKSNLEPRRSMTPLLFR